MLYVSVCALLYVFFAKHKLSGIIPEWACVPNAVKLEALSAAARDAIAIAMKGPGVPAGLLSHRKEVVQGFVTLWGQGVIVSNLL